LYNRGAVDPSPLREKVPGRGFILDEADEG